MVESLAALSRRAGVVLGVAGLSACGVLVDQQSFSMVSGESTGPDGGGSRDGSSRDTGITRDAGSDRGRASETSSGSCSPTCSDNAPCAVNQDCSSGVCTGQKCVPPACAPSCANRTVCGANSDCGSLSCVKGICQAPDCSPTCLNDSACGGNADCASGICGPTNTCSKATCAPSCSVGDICGANSDCASQVCTAGRCIDPPNCAALLAANPQVATGIYEINPTGSATLNAYCDMTAGNGGWTQVYNQDVNDAPAYQPAAAWLAGVNVGSPNTGQYSILYALPGLKGGASYELRLDWPSPPLAGSIQWTQVENPLSAPAVPTISNVVMSPTNQVGCGTFRGLAPSTVSSAALDADSVAHCYYWPVGLSDAFYGGLPSYSDGDFGTPQAILWVR